ncbi:MAG TPA: hypothetical protein VK887_15760 [Pseudonocardiaceae bacterium]|nr:hypothetical protein [Pseudonocardiaceae bacterium]
MGPAGWLAYDAGEHGLSQRYFTSGLHVAHTAGDRSVGVYLLVSMGGTVVHRGRLADGIDLGRAARDAVELANAAHEAARSTPAAVRALAATRFALAQAAAGNTHGFHAAADEARALLDTPGALDTRPPYLTWFGPGALESDLAQGALALAGVTSRRLSDPCKTNSAPPAPPEPSISREQRSLPPGTSLCRNTSRGNEKSARGCSRYGCLLRRSPRSRRSRREQVCW